MADELTKGMSLRDYIDFFLNFHKKEDWSIVSQFLIKYYKKYLGGVIEYIGMPEALPIQKSETLLYLRSKLYRNNHTAVLLHNKSVNYLKRRK